MVDPVVKLINMKWDTNSIDKILKTWVRICFDGNINMKLCIQVMRDMTYIYQIIESKGGKKWVTILDQFGKVKHLEQGHVNNGQLFGTNNCPCCIMLVCSLSLQASECNT